MLLNDIKHKTTLKGIMKHNITEDELNRISTLPELHLYIRRCSRRLWQRQHKDYFKEKYETTYKERCQNRYYLKDLPVNYEV
jgi:hypothetical protein